MSEATLLPEDDDLQAAEAALGVLEPAHAQVALMRAAAEPAFAARVAWWEGHFAELADTVATEPPASLWPRIVAALPANDDLAGTLLRWRIAACVATIAALGFGSALLLRPVPVPVTAPAPAPAMLASLDGEHGHMAAIAWDSASRRLTIAPGKMPLGSHDPELWIIPAGGKPLSLGVIDPARPSHPSVTPERAAQIQAGGTFAITLEPRGGSPSGLPTGPVIGAGTITGT